MAYCRFNMLYMPMEKKSTKRIWTKILTGIAALLIIVFTGNIVLRSAAEKKIRTTLEQFNPYIRAGFSGMHVNLFAASVRIDSLVIHYSPEL